MYRYRGSCGVTRKSLSEVDAHLTKVGKPFYVRGYFYLSRYGRQAAILVRGDKGTARFGGFAWGYSGEGPRGLQTLLQRLGLTQERIDHFTGQMKWNDTIGEHWRIYLS